MYCIRCRDRVRYDRAVVRESDGRTVAGLCDACEREHLGRVLRDGYVDAGPDCLFCARSGVVALPLHRIDLCEVGERAEARGFPVEHTTPRLCADHAERVLGVDTAARGLARVGTEATAVADGGREEPRRGGERND